MSVDAARSVPGPFEFPVTSWGTGASLIQAYTHATDPTDGLDYLFVSQAVDVKPAKPNDFPEQDTWFLRHRLVNGQPKFLDKQRCLGFGHMTSFHARISAAGNPWIWGPVETFTNDGRLDRREPARWKFDPADGVRKRTDPATEFAWKPNALFTNNVAPISSPDWMIGARESHTGYEIYRLFDEKTFGPKAVPLKTVRLTRPADSWQGAACSAKSIVRLYGAPDSKTQVYIQHAWDGTLIRELDALPLRPATGTGADPTDWSELEGVTFIGDVPYLGRKFGSAKTRRYFGFGVR